MIDFVSLHNHTHYSILDSLSAPKDLFLRAKELEQKAITITDHGSCAAFWECFKLSKETGIKLIAGCEFYFQENAPSADRFRHLILIAKNAVGYKNLLTLNGKGFDNNDFNGKKSYSIIDWKLLEQYSEGLICLTGCGNGIVSQLLMNKEFGEAEKTIVKLQNIFKENLAIEVQPNNMKRGSNAYNDEIDQFFLNKRLIEFGKKFDIKVVASCNSHYVKKEDHEIHDVLLCIGSHQTIFSGYRLKYTVPDFYLKSGDEVKNFFTRNYGEEYAEELCRNSVYFADMCEMPDWIDPKYSNTSGKELPEFPVKDQNDYNEFLLWKEKQTDELKSLDEDKLYLQYYCDVNFEKRCKYKPEKLQVYKDRIKEELDVIEFHGFSSYMLIVADYVAWCIANDIPVGPGRGSVAGSLIAYIQNIHQADSIEYDLIFARFHNKEKTSYPDIDMDIAPSGRDKLKEYLKKKYGEDHVAHVSNINTITPKVYVRDISRACELGGSKDEAIRIGNEAADCIAADIHSIDEALKKVPLFVEYCKHYPEFIKYKGICGKYRAFSTHAGGIIISKRSLLGLVPLRKDKDGVLALEYDKEKAEENGLVKMDILGLSTLDTIGIVEDLIKKSGKEFSIGNFDYSGNDQKTYDLISSGDTFCVFQLGTSAGTIDLCRKVKPQSIMDISNINALARPSAREMRSDFILTRDGKKAATLLHPNLERAFGKTYGFGLYEESLMYLAQDIAGWSLHGADKLRKLTKEKGKNPEKVKKWREEFIQGSIQNNINEEIAKRIWDEVITLFQGYGFNLSHSTVYSLISYQTAYLKAHFPIEFLLANLVAEVNSNAQDAKSNIDKIKKELREHKVKIIPPDINKSQLTYTLEGNQLLTGLDALKFVGDDAIHDILEKRPFGSFFDFMHRVDSHKVRANTIQALAASGCLDCFKLPRKTIQLYCSDYRKKLQVWIKKHNPLTETFTYPFPVEGEWNLSELYALENFYLGEAFICKPARAYGNFFDSDHHTIYNVRKEKDKTKLNSIKVIVKDFFEFKVKKETSKYYGQSMIKAIVEDKNGEQCSCTIFPDRWKDVQDRIKLIHSKAIFEPGLAIHFAGSTNNYEDNIGIILDNLYNIALVPAIPADLKAKKINLKESKSKNKEVKTEISLLQQVEDNLYDEGLIDLDEEENDD